MSPGGFCSFTVSGHPLVDENFKRNFKIGNVCIARVSLVHLEKNSHREIFKMKLWLLHTGAALAMRNDSLEINPMTTPATTTMQFATTPTTLTEITEIISDSDDRKVEENKSNDFYENGLAQIADDWDKILAESEAKSSKNDRLDSKFEKIIENLEEKDAEYSGNDKEGFQINALAFDPSHNLIG